MFNFLRNLTKSAEEKRQETVAAYLDGALNGRSQQQFEQEMAQDDVLRQQVEQLRLLKQSLRQLPPREVPRNFILNPAAYGRPVRQPWVQAYPVLRTATALAAFFFIFAIAATIFTSSGAGETASFAPAANIAQSEAVEVTRVVTEVVIEEDAFAYEATVVDAEEPAPEAAAAAADEAVVVEEEMAEEEVPLAEPVTADSLQGETTDDGAAPMPQATAPIVTLTPTIAATPTVSTLPRVTPPTPLPDRDLEQSVTEAEGADVVANAADVREDEETAVHLEITESDSNPISSLNTLQWLLIGLGLLLLLLAGLTFYARRQR